MTVTDWNDPLPKISASESLQYVTDDEVREAIASLQDKARKCRQEAAVLEVLIEELEDSLHGGA